MQPKFACADFTFPLLSHQHALQLIAMLEFDGVDIGLFEERSHLWPSREFENVSTSAGQLKQKLDDRGLRAADIFLQMAEDFTPYELMQTTNYQGWLGIEYVWVDWEHCNECDNLSETILFRDFFKDLVNQ